LGENNMEEMLQRLDRLTMEESRMTVAQTTEVVYRLFNNMKVVLEGLYISWNWFIVQY
jgi:hypothetical protein